MKNNQEYSFLESTPTICYHCKNECIDDCINYDEKNFCCNGCQFVYDILKQNNLDDYYKIDENIKYKPVAENKSDYSYLGDNKIYEKLILFRNNNKVQIKFRLPDIHCASCLWLLENLPDFFAGVQNVNVNFLEKEALITFNENETNIIKISNFLSQIGYPPNFNLSDLEEKKSIIDKNNELRSLYLKVGISFFCFGNVMMLAFPDYFSNGEYNHLLKNFIEYMNLIFIIPITYAAWDYYKSAYNGIKYKYINIDFPIALGLISLLGRSLYDILSGTGPGFVDSYGGLTFFLLVGKLFQIKTYSNIKFDRDFRSYFPLSVIKVYRGEKTSIPVSEIDNSDELFIRNGEIIPTDSILLSDSAMIDYSFVTGEAEPVNINKGSKIYAGGKLYGSAINIMAEKKYNQSYLTDLWNKNQIKKDLKQNLSKISESVGKRFTIIISVLSVLGFAYWYQISPEIAFNVLTSVLVVACPCAIAVSLPFSFGSTLRILGRDGCYIKSNETVERLETIDTIILDKTGTLTEIDKSTVEFHSFRNETNQNHFIDKLSQLSNEELNIISKLTENSIHPISKLIKDYINKFPNFTTENIELIDFEELPGKGLKANYNGKTYRIGSQKWLNEISKLEYVNNDDTTNSKFSADKGVFFAIDNQVVGKFDIISNFRSGIANLLKNITKKYKVIILSGDTDKDKNELDKITDGLISNGTIEAYFEFTPDKKAKFVEDLNSQGRKTMMLGDGLNDSMALNSSEIGVAVTENNSNFTPGADIILLGDKLSNLDKILQLANDTKLTIYLSFGLSFLYNLVGLYFGLQGKLTPLIAAIFMPTSSVSVVIFNVALITYFAKRNGFLKRK